MHYIAHMWSRSRLQNADCICVKIPWYISLIYFQDIIVKMHYYMLNSYSSFLHAGPVGRYSISFKIYRWTCTKCLTCVILISVWNDCYNRRNFFVPNDFFCQFAILRRSCNVCIPVYADLRQMKLAQTFLVCATCTCMNLYLIFLL